MKREEKKKCAFEEDYEGCFISLQRLSPPCAAGSNSPATTVGGGKNRERAEGLSVGEGEREPPAGVRMKKEMEGGGYIYI